MVVEATSVPYSDGKFGVQVVALHKGKQTGAFAYLQGMRQGTLKAVSKDPEKTATALGYHRKKETFAAMLADAIEGPIDAVISPPSDFPEQAEIYRQAIVSKHSVSVDLTTRLSRPGQARAGSGATSDEVIAALT